jgi:Rrf2 family protein
MLSLSKKVDYALISLAYLVEHRGLISSARAIAQTHDLPLPLLMNILKAMHHQGILCSERGSKGGYQICIDLDTLSLYDLIDAVEDTEQEESGLIRKLSDRPPLRALQYRMIDFLKKVRLSDLVIPGRRIEVLVEVIHRKCKCHAEPQLAVVATANV